MKTLILDDREDGRYLLESLLKGNGHEIESVANGAEALEKLKTERFDLIISDILMPVMDGFQFCQKVKSEKMLRDIPFIFYTATYTGPQDEEFAIALGANRFLRKPCEPEEILSVINEVTSATNQIETTEGPTTPLPEEETLRLYSERLVRKLEQKMLEAEANANEVQAERKKFQLLAEELPLGLALIGSDDTTHYLNPRFTELFGYSQTDLPNLQTGLEKVFPDPGYRHEIMTQWQKIKNSRSFPMTVPWTVQFRCRNGVVKQVRIRPVFLAKGEQLVTYEDVSEQIQLEEKLRQSQKMESIATLAGGIAHDFNNILAAVMGHAGLIEREAQPGSEIVNDARSILQATERARQLVGHIMTFSRQKEHVKAPMVLYLVVKEVLSLMRATLPATIEIRQNINNDGVVLADSTQMHQVVLNLCTNSYHAMRKTGGILEVSMTRTVLTPEDAGRIPGLTEGPYLMITVKDTGCGMTPEVKARIFDPYFTTKGEGEGTGLGLSVTHGIIKSHHGAIDVSSEPGVGSTFRVYLPEVKSLVEKPGESSLEPLPTGHERILLVDDEVSLTRCFQQMLATLGYQSATKNSATDALEEFRKNPDAFDLVITDLTMPKMTGFQLATEILHLRADIPIILCSGTGDGITADEVISKGFKGLIKKPFSLRGIAQAVRRSLDHSRES